MWRQDSAIGCIIQPRQTICVNPWITFPKAALNIPIKMNQARAEEPVPDPIYVLVEAQFPAAPQEGDSPRDQSSNNLFVEEFGHPLAWRVDSHFSFLLRTDTDRLLQFILASFMAANLNINNDLQLLRIQCKFEQDQMTPINSLTSNSPFSQPWT